MNLLYYHVDAFASEVFRGNPAGVCPLPEWFADEILQKIAAENNLPETAFFVLKNDRYELRWFTPEVEIDLCGHATLATAHILFNTLTPGSQKAVFDTRSGTLEVLREGENLSMLFPSRPGIAAETPEGLDEAIGVKPLEVYKSRDYLLVLESEEQVRALEPDMVKLAKVDAFGVIVTAAGSTFDFVSRFFAPGAGIPEDPVTGSSHCTLIPYWSARLGKKVLSACQISARSGVLGCEDLGDKVKIAGKAVTYLEGTLTLPV